MSGEQRPTFFEITASTAILFGASLGNPATAQEVMLQEARPELAPVPTYGYLEEETLEDGVEVAIGTLPGLDLDNRTARRGNLTANNRPYSQKAV